MVISGIYPAVIHWLTRHSFRSRCKFIVDSAELREHHVKNILRTKDAEITNLSIKLELERRRADAEAARCRTLTGQVSTFSNTETELRSQLNIYVEKFKQVCLLWPEVHLMVFAEITAHFSAG